MKITSFFIALIGVFLLTACDAPSPPAVPIAYEPGQVAKGEDLFGTFFTYVPTHSFQPGSLASKIG